MEASCTVRKTGSVNWEIEWTVLGQVPRLWQDCTHWISIQMTNGILLQGMVIIKMLMQSLSERIIVLTKIRCSVWEVPLAEAKIWWMLVSAGNLGRRATSPVHVFPWLKICWLWRIRLKRWQKNWQPMNRVSLQNWFLQQPELWSSQMYRKIIGLMSMLRT